MPEPIIHTEHLSRFFGSVKAVDDLSLEVPAGIVFGFLGPNGAGKTTTIHLLLGLLEPTAGQAWVLGFDTRTQSDEIRARSGALLEFAGLYERMSAQDNLDLYGRIYHMPAPARQVGVIRQGKLVTIGAPDELRARTGGPQAEIVGHGFTEQMLATLRERPEVALADLQNSHLLLELRGESEMGPIVSLLVHAGAEVEEVRRGKASLEDVFLTLMEEESK